MEKKTTDSGAKAHQRADSEWRAKPYSDWHRTLGKSLMMMDVDYIEWRFRGGELMPVGVMEVTRVDGGKAVSQGYLDAIVRRYESRDLQARATRKVAEALDVKAYIVLFRINCREFWIYNLSDRNGWDYYNQGQMEAFLEGL